MHRLTPDTPPASAVMVPAAELATLRAKAAMADELERILCTSWKPAERAFAARLRIASEGWEREGTRRKKAMTVEEAGKICGVTRNTASAMLEMLNPAQVAYYTVEDITNSEGKPRKKTTVVYHDQLPDELPFKLDPSDLHKCDQARAKLRPKKREFAALKGKLDDLLARVKCPNCEDPEAGTLQGEITATCSKCHNTIEGDALAGLIDGWEQPSPGPAEETGIIEPVGVGQAHCVESVQWQKTPNKRALRELRGKVTTPAPSVTYKYDDPDDGLEVQISHCVESVQWQSDPDSCQSPCNSVLVAQVLTEESLSVVPDGVATLTGQASGDHLDGLGGMFSLADSQKHGINGRDDMGAPVNYLDMPLAADSPAVRAHLAAGGSISLLPEHSSMAVLDDDKTGPAFIREYPDLALADRVFRRNAPGRVKIIVQCPDPGESRTFKNADGTRKIELIGKGKHAIIAGTHETGAVVELAPGYEAVLMTWAELVAIAEAWTGDKKPANNLSDSKPRPTQALAVVQPAGAVNDSTPYDVQVRSAIAWFNEQHANQLAAAAAASTMRRRGAYVALRAGDSTPSARQFSPDAWRDYGNDNEMTRGVTDAFDMLVIAERKDKRRFIFETVNEWRGAVHDLAPIPDKMGQGRAAR